MLDAQGVPRFVSEYFAFSPQVNGAFFTASLVTQGVIARSGANLLYPAIAVNAQQRGGIVFTLVGPNDFPSAAFVPVNNTSVGAIQIARAGNEPEDGFSGYPEFGAPSPGVARWGDYSAAAIDTDGVTWMATEYTPDIARYSAGELVHLYHSAAALAKRLVSLTAFWREIVITIRLRSPHRVPVISPPVGENLIVVSTLTLA